jgi:PST family polysaccharide transporter
MKPVFKNALFLFILQFFNYVAPLLLIPYLTRALPLKEYGAVMVAMASVQLAFVVTDYGFALSATYEISKNRSDRDFINQLIARIFTAKLLLLSFAIVVLIGVSFLPAYVTYQPVFLCGILAVISQAYQPLWLFQGIEKMKNYTGYMVITKMLYVVLVFLFVKTTGDGAWVLLSWSGANFAGMIIALLMVKRLGFALTFSKVDLAINELKRTAQYFWSRIAVALFTSASSVVVGTSGLAQAALFSSAEQAYKAGQNVTSPVSQALYPHMARDKNWILFKKVVYPIAIVIACGGLVVSYYGDFFINFIFGARYIDAKQVLNIFMLILVINCISMNFGYPACAAIERPDIANKTVMIGSVLHISLVVLLFLTNRVTAINVSLAILSTETLIMLLRVIMVSRVTRLLKAGNQ